MSAPYTAKTAKSPSCWGPGVEWLQLLSAGVDHYVAAGVIAGPHVTTSAGPAYANTVAQHALCLMLACARQIPGLSRATEWSKPRIERLWGSTVAILGCGRIGRSLVTMLEPFDVRVLATATSGRPISGVASVVTPERSIEVLAKADFVVLAAPATEDTKGMIGVHELQAMKETAFLVNVARGVLIDTNALVAALDRGDIAGDGLDVTDPEPLPKGHPLWGADNVIITQMSPTPTPETLQSWCRRMWSDSSLDAPCWASSIAKPATDGCAHELSRLYQCGPTACCGS